ncbi:MAG TPA: hypothetical protein VGW35_04205 [Methylomirabilota bacterium]|nr:hypothetical protein [Methylomirabilota bacterium]
MKLGLILSNDWELYGDGSGDFFEVQHGPMAALMETCERHGAKLTLMAEVGQQWAHQRIGDRHPWAREVAEAWEKQAQEAVHRGHDVQLHLHPQWTEARYEAGWHVDYSRYALGGLPPAEQAALLERGRRYLEELLQDIRPAYRCLAFRAGGFLMEPSTAVIRSLIRAGIECDTSVCKGRHYRGSLGSYDFRAAPSHYEPWFVSGSDLTRPAPPGPGLLEIPIYSEPFTESPVLRKVRARLGLGWDLAGARSLFGVAERRTGLSPAEHARHRRYLRRADAWYPVDQAPAQRAAAGRRLGSILEKMVRRSSLMLDYDAVMPSVAAAMLVRLAERVADRDPGRVLPVMAIGHVKSMVSTDYVDEFLTKAKGALGGALVFWTLQEAVQYTKHAGGGRALASSRP